MEFLLLVFAGAGVGFAIGLTGVGGGSLMTPILLLFGYSAPVAIGTDLLYAAITKSSSALSHHRHGNVHWRIVLVLGLGSIPASLVVHLLLANSSFQQSPEFEELLTFSLGIMLLLTSLILLGRDRIRQSALTNRPAALMEAIHKNRAFFTLTMGAVLGACVTLSSVGAGAFGAAILLTIYSQVSAIRIVGTDIAHAVPLTLFAGSGYLLSGYVDWQLLAALLLGSLPATHFGSRVGTRVSERQLQRVMILILTCLGIYYSLGLH